MRPATARPATAPTPALLPALRTALVAALLMALAGAALPHRAAAQEADPDPAGDLHPLIAFSIEHANELYPSPEEPAFAHALPAPYVVLSRLDVFADSLAASVLLEDAPLLFTDGEVVEPAVEAELDRLMPGGGTVYVLGGEAAIDEAVVEQLAAAGHAPRRIAGESRIETAIAIADLHLELGGSAQRIGLARATGPEPTAEWADAIAAGPWSASRGAPILLSTTDQLHPAVADWIQANGVTTTELLGGEAALSPAVEAAVPDPTRYAGPNRFASAVAIADELFTFTLYHFRIIAADDPDGWGYALAGVGMAIEERSPVLLVLGDAVPQETAERTCANGSRARITVLGPTSGVGQDVRDELTSDCPG